MVGIVMSENGVADKYIGDAIMAVFGAPVPKPRDAIHAVRAAVNMRHALRHLNARLAERGIAPLRTGIGVHTGLVVAVNIGSERRMEYTVIGDAVNLASRLESNTKELGVPILISHDTYLLTQDEIVTRPVKEILVKGRAAQVMTYEILGIRGEAVIEPTSDMRRSAPPRHMADSSCPRYCTPHQCIRRRRRRVTTAILDRRQPNIAGAKLLELMMGAALQARSLQVKKAATIRQDLEGIFAYVTTGLSDGPTERLNGMARIIT